MSAITQAASVLLARGPHSTEVYVVRRAESLRFFGGFLAFPGGKVSLADAEVPVVRLPQDPEPIDAARFVAVARELFEETGILLARRADGSFLSSSPSLEYERREMVADRIPFAQVLIDHGLVLYQADFKPLGTLVTPAFSTIRMDTTFFVAVVPPEQQPVVWPGELEEGNWTTAADVLASWRRGECLIAPPAITILEAIEGRPVAEAPERVAPQFHAHRAGQIPPIYFAPNVLLIPLRAAVLPPSTHTNAFLVGRDPTYLIDPGTTELDEQERLFTLLDAQGLVDGQLTAVILTHHHPDHIGAALACARRYHAPVWAHACTARILEGQIPIERTIEDGDCLDLGPAPDGHGFWHLRALHTPGHAAGHLAFYEPRYRLLFAGDLVSTQSSVVIAPPDGDLAQYLDSLRRLKTFDCRLLLPSHGSASARPFQTIDDSLAHRAKREAMLLEALGQGCRTEQELVLELYRGLADALMRFATLQLRAGLTKLEREGRVEAMGEGPDSTWRLRPPG